MTQLGGIGLVFIAGGEALFYGSMTAGAGAGAVLALPTAESGSDIYLAGTVASALGSGLIGWAGNKGAWKNAITAGTLEIISRSAGAGPPSVIVDFMLGPALQQKELNCE